MKHYLTRKQVEQHYPLSQSYLAWLAHKGRGPQFRIVGRNAVYLVTEIEDWLDSLLVTSKRSRSQKRPGRPRKRRQA
ncbi:hypothetical protein SAMN04488071_0482 [Kordiimonas lacus]|uniref:Transcriptional regulator, AlpA family n=1 Tax=Kordiimonas lacus TaxID=637679 RepID=A0A1G6U684_9PROT|nr:hypothetical protein SAMN04488071_0482 [Kordiimonas lacus]